LSRKGQYLAIETVFSLGLSLIVAIAAIGLFNNYRETVMETIGDRDYTVIKSEVKTAIHNLEEADSGSYIGLEIPQPEQDSYRVSLTDGELRVDMLGETRRTEIQGTKWVSNFRGSTEGSSVRIMKLNDNIVLRPG
jgi:hypothetical protein